MGILMLSKALIETHLDLPYPYNIHLFDSLDSTQSYLKSLAPSNVIEICLSESQSEGRGRLGRVWESPHGKNIYCSFRLPFSLEKLQGLSLVLGLGLYKVLENYSDLSLKWPNDLYWQDKKLAGILVELLAGNIPLIGFGLNVNDSDQSLLEKGRISLALISGKEVERSALVASILNTMFSSLLCFKDEGFLPFHKAWTAVDYLYGKSYSVGKLSGKARGVDKEGYLLLEDEQFILHKCH